MYNQFLTQLLSNQSQTLHKGFWHIEAKNYKITLFLDFEILHFLANTLSQVCIISCSQFSRYRSEIVHRCFIHFEDLHVL